MKGFAKRLMYIITSVGVFSVNYLEKLILTAEALGAME